MSTKPHYIDVQGLPIEVVRKDIKNLHVGVYPPAGRVRVAAPLRINDEAVRLGVISRLGWIRRQQAHFNQQQRQSQREFATGESHYFMGRRYRLNVIEHNGPSFIHLPNNRSMQLFVNREKNDNNCEVVLQHWYRQRLRMQIPALLEKWEAKVGVKVDEVRVRKMKTRWGSCNAAAGRIWLNLELAKKSPACVEYILVHEMIHLFERRHNERFRLLMDTIMPSWQLYREELNQAPLAHERWRY
ncbi:MAG: M48 family metallopeptidase [Acidobacteriota bacterium]|nr:M48 family metallopeptidase [Acidobacteriota bacterium]